MQDVPSVFETDLFAPLIEFGEQRSGKQSGQDFATTRALRILADHGRGATFLMADGVVPSNEDRGYILRRILRRAIQQGRRLGIADGFVPDLCQVVIDKMGEPYPQLHEERDTIMRWAAAEEEGFGRTLAQGERLLDDLIEKARADGAQAIPAEEAFRLHDTFGFPFELTTELLAEQGLGVDQEGFAGLMEQARVVARGEGRGGAGDGRARARRRASPRPPASPPTSWATSPPRPRPCCAPCSATTARVLAKLEDSPFYAEGGGQVSDGGLVETPSGRARVAEVLRLGSDQALALEPLEGDLVEGERVHAVVERDARLATMRNHTATHLLHAALRERLGTHVRQAGSYVGPGQAALRLHPRRAHVRG